ncbi:dTMP kinase [Thalassotalea eurytherma]|uniref:Thymidylate kinase n=1 Tax=Thalassotalea eurytherma TaxID=1144278 RepID=A0ABQ6H587_9GAMM|nr:dTMP kinase [Thalassotalea eurytherma]GLX81925.1 thymidylate kinase [Thalassotalea eurytherma]
MLPGKFIVIEGLEGAGKSSAISIVEQALNNKQVSFDKTREPGGTPLAEKLRELVKSADHSELVTQETELLLMYAARSQLLVNKILPSLEKGLWVIGDRHDLSSRAYQGGGRQIPDDVIGGIANATLKGFTPDLTIYLDIDPKIGLKRARARGELDRIELEAMSFFERTRDKYLLIANHDDSIVIVDASQSMEQVHQDIEKHVNQFIDFHKS